MDKQYRIIKEKLKKQAHANIIAIQKIGVFIWGETKAEADKLAALFLDMVKIKKYGSANKNIDFEEIKSYLSKTYGNMITGLQKEKKDLSEKIAADPITQEWWTSM